MTATLLFMQIRWTNVESLWNDDKSYPELFTGWTLDSCISCEKGRKAFRWRKWPLAVLWLPLITETTVQTGTETRRHGTGKALCIGKWHELFLLSVCRSRCRTLSYFFSTMSACMMLFFHHENYGLNLWTVSQLQLNVFLYKNCHGHGVSSQQ